MKKVDEHAIEVIVANEATAILAVVGPQAVQRRAQRGNVQHIPNEDLVTTKLDDGRPSTQNRSIRVVAHADPHVRPMVGHESRPVRQHVIRSTRVRHRENDGREALRVVRNRMRGRRGEEPRQRRGEPDRVSAGGSRDTRRRRRGKAQGLVFRTTG